MINLILLGAAVISSTATALFLFQRRFVTLPVRVRSRKCRG